MESRAGRRTKGEPSVSDSRMALGGGSVRISDIARTSGNTLGSEGSGDNQVSGGLHYPLREGWGLARLSDGYLSMGRTTTRNCRPAFRLQRGSIVDLRGRYSNSWQQLITQFHGLLTDMPHDT
jgi:hypothetical protein